jgi:TP901 family phage tail tape measure protein
MPENPFARDPAVTVGVGADTSEFGSAMDGAIDKLGRFRQTVGLAGGALAALATGALAKSVQAAADFEEAMVEVEKVTSPETMRAVSDSVRELAEEIPLAQSELAGLAADAGRFGIEGPENIEKFTESVAKMAEATNLGSEQAGESLARLATLTNTPVSEIENLGSSINALSNNYATSAQEIVDSMLRASASLSQVGLNQRQIAGLSASLNEVSESSERAGTRLRRLGQEMLNPKNVADLANALGMTEAEFVQMRRNAPVQLIMQMARAMGEGGQEADALRQALSTTSRQALGALSQNLEGATQAQEKANRSFKEGTSLQKEFEAATDTFNARVKLLQNRLGNVGIEIGESLLPDLKNLVNDVSGAAEQFAEWNEKTDGAVGRLALAGSAITGVGLLLTAFVGGPATLAIGAAAALGTAYATNFAGMREATNAFADDAGSSLMRTTDTLGITSKNAFSTSQEFHRLAKVAGISLVQGLDLAMTGFATIIDMMGIGIGQATDLANAFGGIAAAAGHLEKGNMQKARKAFDRVGKAAENNRERVSKFWERFEERAAGASERADSRRELFSDFKAGRPMVVDNATAPRRPNTRQGGGSGFAPTGGGGEQSVSVDVNVETNDEKFQAEVDEIYQENDALRQSQQEDQFYSNHPTG